jgi:2-amino-4-hydroxy-6-hydroxymethyldihydropteridine diphosphokinase/dihydropteroate synthase
MALSTIRQYNNYTQAMIILGLGSNIGDRRAFLADAVRRLSLLLSGIRLSRMYESKALLPGDAPAQWDMSFYNMALCGETSLSPEALLVEIKTIERDMGRQVRGFWGPREIDIDILAAGGVVLDTPELNLPHHELLNRDFALLPLAEIAPEWVYPAPGGYKGWRAADILAAKGYKTGENLKDIGMLQA